MKRLAVIWIVGIALLGLEMSAMLWAKSYWQTAAATEVSASGPAGQNGPTFPLSPFPTAG